MKKLTVLMSALVLGTTMLSCDDDKTDEKVTVEVSNKEKAQAVLLSFESGDDSALLNYVNGDKYIQHNLGFPDGRKAVVDAMNAGALDGTTVSIRRVFEDDDVVFMHSQYKLFGADQVGFDVFRFEDGLIVEHWDNLQVANGDDVNGANPNTMLNGPTESTTANGSENKTFVSNMLDDLFIKGNWSNWSNYFDSTQYVQHNPDYPNGTDIFANFPDGFQFYTSSEFVYSDGNFVLSGSVGPELDANFQPTGNEIAYYDLFRIENGLVVEHWDIIQAIPEESTWANTNGKF